MFYYLICTFNFSEQSGSRRYTFRIDAPLCSSIALVINETTWHFLSPLPHKAGRWQGKLDVGDRLGQLSVYARFLPHPLASTTADDRGSDFRQVGRLEKSSIEGIARRRRAEAERQNEIAYVKLLDYVLVHDSEFI
ncbi:unnamed protein product [Protopolystoma xenopodis]|uniref:Uncharacterized protein n=1 Tax=Protopolystoma xenopodis TaxID=117903 RepID=A0A3S4ZG51_9PLAT|nr:unnamed protein product [Protopolystoma xenopodis]